DGIRDRNVTGVQTCALPISMNRKKYQQLPAHSGIVFVSRRPFMPVFGSVTCIQSLLASGDSPVPEGVILSISGSSSGKSSSGTALIVPSSQCIFAIGSPQYVRLQKSQSRNLYVICRFTTLWSTNQSIIFVIASSLCKPSKKDELICSPSPVYASLIKSPP